MSNMLAAALGQVTFTMGGQRHGVAQDLLALLKDTNPEVREAALHSLHYLGPPLPGNASELLAPLLKDRIAGVRHLAADVLGDIGPGDDIVPGARAAVPALIAALKTDKDKHV